MSPSPLSTLGRLAVLTVFLCAPLAGAAAGPERPAAPSATATKASAGSAAPRPFPLPARAPAAAATLPAPKPAPGSSSARSPVAPSAAGPSVSTSGTPRPRRVRPRPAVERPLLALGRANAEARDGPASGVFVNSALYHPFEPGRLYAIHTSPRFLTTIALRPGEKLIAKAAGDTVRWVLGETEAGAAGGQQVIVLVKPMRAGLRTNLVLTTDERTYLIDAVSTDSGAYTSVLSWTYPLEEAQARAATLANRADPPLAPLAVPVEKLDFGYAITPPKKKAPAWTPVRVFDDGAKTYIEFPPDLAVREAPPVFLLDADDQAQLVNARLAGRYLVIDRLIERAELRLGDKRPAIVRLTRLASRP